jgi:23S rRNA pseudouridine1911/1915/1917 synthase
VKERGLEDDHYPRPTEVDPDALLTVIRVPREWAKWRLDRVVHATFPRMSRTRAQAVVAAGAYEPSGRRLRKNDRVRPDAVILLYREPFEEPDLPTDCPVVYEDDQLLAIDKPPGLPVHPSARYHHNTVTEVLKVARPGEFLALCHRIDRETSGVLLLAKTREAERFIKRRLERHVLDTLAGGPGGEEELHGVAKRYLAITWGVPEPRAGRIEHALALDENNPLKLKMRLATLDEPEAQSAATRYEVLGVRANAVTGARYALVACDLESGRQHQIRMHLAFVKGTPIVGDKLYGPFEDADDIFRRGADQSSTDDDRARLELARHALHAPRMVLPDPADPRRRIVVVAPLPADLAAFWDALIEPASDTRE